MSRSSAHLAKVCSVKQESDDEHLRARYPCCKGAGALKVAAKRQRPTRGATGEHADVIHLARRRSGRCRCNRLVFARCEQIRGDCRPWRERRGCARRQRRRAVERERRAHTRHVGNRHRRRSARLCRRGMRHCLGCGVGGRELRRARGLAVDLQVTGVGLLSVAYGVVERRGSHFYYKGEHLAGKADDFYAVLRERPELVDELYQVTLETALELIKEEPMINTESESSEVDEFEVEAKELEERVGEVVEPVDTPVTKKKLLRKSK